jgi:hypothetical protein
VHHERKKKNDTYKEAEPAERFEFRCCGCWVGGKLSENKKLKKKHTITVFKTSFENFQSPLFRAAGAVLGETRRGTADAAAPAALGLRV